MWKNLTNKWLTCLNKNSKKRINFQGPSLNLLKNLLRYQNESMSNGPAHSVDLRTWQIRDIEVGQQKRHEEIHQGKTRTYKKQDICHVLYTYDISYKGIYLIFLCINFMSYDLFLYKFGFFLLEGYLHVLCFSILLHIFKT